MVLVAIDLLLLMHLNHMMGRLLLNLHVIVMVLLKHRNRTRVLVNGCITDRRIMNHNLFSWNNILNRDGSSGRIKTRMHCLVNEGTGNHLLCDGNSITLSICRLLERIKHTAVVEGGLVLLLMLLLALLF